MTLLKLTSSKLSNAKTVAALLLAANLVIIALVRSNQLRVMLTDITFPIVGLLAAAVLFMASHASRQVSSRLALAWGVIALGQLSYALGDTTWGILEAGFKQAPFPSAADGFYLAYYGLFLAGILLLPAQKLTRNEWVKRILDIGVVMLSAGLIFWTFLIGPQAVANQSESPLVYTLSLAYPVGDLVLLWALVVLVYRQIKNQPTYPILMLAASATAQIITDSFFSYQSINGTYQSGSFSDIGWVVAYVCAGLAGILQIQAITSAQAKSNQKEKLPGILARFNRWNMHLPYFWLISAYILLLESYYNQLPVDFITLSVGVSFIIGLVLLRQVVTINENIRLFDQVNYMLQHAQTQAGELQKTNQVLETEIAERQRVEEKLSFDALHDALTGLPNRVLFIDRLSHAIERFRMSGNPYSVLFLDLDYFKVVNDSLGHTLGDQLLVAISRKLSDCLRVSDTVARLGGDEFVILLEGIQAAEAVSQTARRIQQSISQPFDLGSHAMYSSASIGIVLSSPEYSNAEEVLRDADLAMYRAKALGKNRVEFFDPSLRERAISRLAVENELRRAIEQQEFHLHYQPILSLQTSQLIGFEALIRWQHPARGMLPPIEFLPVAEESGLIVPMGEWVLEEACRQTREWQKLFPAEQPLCINVNISYKQFIQEDFVKMVEEVLQKTGVEPACLRLEITESVLIDNTSAAASVFEQLTKIGVQLQVDDFGTGYSSLSYLHRYPIHTIKIDRSFIQEIDEEAKHSDLVRTMVLMAANLGMDAIAEGVETESQMRVLKELGCKYGQGYLISRPMEASKAREWMRTKI